MLFTNYYNLCKMLIGFLGGKKEEELVKFLRLSMEDIFDGVFSSLK